MSTRAASIVALGKDLLLLALLSDELVNEGTSLGLLHATLPFLMEPIRAIGRRCHASCYECQQEVASVLAKTIGNVTNRAGEGLPCCRGKPLPSLPCLPCLAPSQEFFDFELLTLQLGLLKLLVDVSHESSW